ncbi:SIMPL domain-containing protein [Chitinophaga pendula]|nr:SIMPL domain-containing protein [Chitinophaga pendula]UCJ07039.1 SIMPL domain-containing protein [Chitinophaga pendula]
MKMKKGMLLLAGLFLAITTFAQQVDNKPPVKKIEVNGSAEIEITPDEIYLNIALREYKNKSGKVDISTLEKQLQKAVTDAGIPKENFTIENVFGTNYDMWWKKKKNDQDFLARKQYRLKLNRLDKINLILAAVDEEGIESVNIGSFTHSKMEEYRKEAKIKALQAAKAKADYMLTAIDEKIAGILEVQEINTDNYTDVRPEMANVMFAKSREMDTAAASNIDFKTIKVRAEVRAVFFIK